MSLTGYGLSGLVDLAPPRENVVSSLAAYAKPLEIVFVDSRVPDATVLLRDLDTSGNTDRVVVPLDPTRDGVTQITEVLSAYHNQNVSAVHIVSHGSQGALLIGDTTLSTANINTYQSQLASWAYALRPNADILLYGCDVAADAIGKDFVQRIARLTATNVAASTEAFGSPTIGGSWSLGFTTGPIDIASVFDAAASRDLTGLLNTYTVTNTNDAGAGSLRQAITDANANSGLDSIGFNIPGGGIQTITLSAVNALPVITDQVSIDATTQPGYSSHPLIELDGTNTPFGSNGIETVSANVTILGLSIYGFTGNGVQVDGVSGTVVQADYIGLHADGTAAKANGTGVVISSGANAVIGGTSATQMNVISGNGGGILIRQGSAGCSILGNRIGTNPAGTSAAANLSYGILISSSLNNTIGGATPGSGNIISGNATYGIWITGTTSTGNSVLGNAIGTDFTGSAPLGNGSNGIRVTDATNTAIGGNTAASGNIIAFNTLSGIVVTGAASSTAIRGDKIIANGGIGIDLGDDGVTANTGTENPSSPNNGMNSPVLTTVNLVGNILSLAGYVGSSPSQAAFAGSVVEFFLSDGTSTGYGSGTPLGVLTADTSGDFSGSLTVSGLSAGNLISATATDSVGNTSEFGLNTILNTPPTVVTAASASSNPVKATTTIVSVLGADDGGEANLTYTWSVLSKPSGAADPTYSSNGTNSAKDTTITFTEAGDYTFQVTILDKNGLSTTSSVSVTVLQIITSISIAPTPPAMAENTSYPYGASVLDQFGSPLAVQPTLTWTVDGGGAGGTVDNSGLYRTPVSNLGTDVIRASDGSLSGTAVVTITHDGIFSGGVDVGVPKLPGYYSFNAGTYTVTGGDNGNSNTNDQFQFPYNTFAGDSVLVARITSTTGTSAQALAGLIVRDSLASNSAFVGIFLLPGNQIGFQYRTIAGANLSAASASNVNAPQWVKLVRIGNNFNGYYSADGSNWTALGGTATYSAPNAMLGGFIVTSVNPNSVSTATFDNAAHYSAPKILETASASPMLITGTSASLSVLGAESEEESGLTYTWAAVGNPPATVTFSANHGDKSKDTIASFSAPGNYDLQVTVTNPEGLSTTSDVIVTVNQTLTTINISPPSASLKFDTTQTFTAVGYDQFAAPMTIPPSFNWSNSGAGSIDASGRYSAGNIAGVSTITASNGSVSGVASVIVSDTAPVLSGTANLTTINEDAVSNPGTLVSSLIAGFVSDPDPGAMSGIAVIAVDNTYGRWQYTMDGGGNWTSLLSPSSSNAQLLAADSLTLVRFLPNVNWNGSINTGITFRAWDQTTGVAGSAVDTSINGGATAFSSAIVSAGITVNPVNDPPVRTSGSVSDLTVTENSGIASLGFGGLAYSPGGGADEASQTLTYTILSVPSLSLGRIVLGDGISVVSAGQTLSLFQIQGMRFVPLAYGFGGPSRFSFHVMDNGGTANGGVDSITESLNVSVTEMNQPPSLVIPVTQHTMENSPVVFGQSTGNAIVVSDLDANGRVEQLTLSAINGIVSLHQTIGLTFLFGSGTGDAIVSMRGTLTNLTAALDGMVFLPDQDFVGTSQLRISADDLGNSGLGGPATVSATVSLLVFNSAPTLRTGLPLMLSPISEIFTAGVNPGTTVSQVVMSAGLNPILDSDLDADAGIAIVGVDTRDGAWQFSTDSGMHWSSMGGVSDGSAIVLKMGGNDLIRFLPNPFFFGSAGLSFRAWDSTDGVYDGTQGVDATITSGQSAFSSQVAVASIVVKVAVFDAAPIVGDVVFDLSQDDFLGIDAPGLLIHSYDSDGGRIQAILIAGPEHGRLTLNTDGAMNYRPDPQWSGIDRILFRVTDGRLLSAEATATLIVHANPSESAATPAEDASFLTPNLIAAGIPPSPGYVNSDPLPLQTPSGPSTGGSGGGGIRSLQGTNSLGGGGSSGGGFSSGRRGPRSITSSSVVVAGAVNGISATGLAVAGGINGNGSLTSIARGAGSLGVGTSLGLRLAISELFSAYDDGERAKPEQVAILPLLSNVIGEGGKTLLIETQPLWNALDTMTSEMNENVEQVVMTVAVVSGLSVSVGYVVWSMRLGYLVAGLMAATPLWREFDPLAVLEEREGKPWSGRSRGESWDDETDDSLVTLVEHRGGERTSSRSAGRFFSRRFARKSQREPGVSR